MFTYFIKALNKLGVGVWIGLGGAVVGGAVGVFSIVVSGQLSALLFILPLLVLFFWLFWKFLFGPMAQHERLMDIGVNADATVISFRENGSSLQRGGALPKAGVALELDVHARDRAPFRATVNTFISMFEVGMYQPGNTLHVKYDPQRPELITIAEGTPSMGMYKKTSP